MAFITLTIVFLIQNYRAFVRGRGGGVQLSGGRRQRTKLHIELAPGEKQAVYISLGDCDSLGDVQAQIADVCEEAGLDGLTPMTHRAASLCM